MHCKFLDHGVALAYQETVKPCCVWHFDAEWKNKHQIQTVNFVNWHKNDDLKKAKNMLENQIWPENCNYCKDIEQNGRGDSLRLSGLRSYSHYSDDDIILEIRPGSVCNFACQTCWPAASSRVYQYYQKANLIDPNIESKMVFTSIDTKKSLGFQNFEFLESVKHRIRTLILLGGEPFYDKACINLIDWWNQHTNAELIVFTNGSCFDHDKISQFKNPAVLVFSLDAAGKPAEYIRFGTVWDSVWNNYNAAKQMQNLRVRVNITTSVYNYFYIPELIDLLLEDWPEVVTFGPAYEKHLTECVIPAQYRPELVDKLSACVGRIETSTVEQGQKSNAINAIQSIINNLKNLPFDYKEWDKFSQFVMKMDSVKSIDIQNYCEFTAKILAKNLS